MSEEKTDTTVHMHSQSRKYHSNIVNQVMDGVGIVYQAREP